MKLSKGELRLLYSVLGNETTTIRDTLENTATCMKRDLLEKLQQAIEREEDFEELSAEEGSIYIEEDDILWKPI